MANRLFHEVAAAFKPFSGNCTRVLHILQHRDSHAQWLGNVMFGLLSEWPSLKALALPSLASLVETINPLHSGIMPWHDVISTRELEQPLPVF